MITALRKYLALTLFFVGCSLHSFSQKKVQCTPPTISSSADVTICSGTSTTLTGTVTAPGTSPYSYAWTPNNGSLSNANIVTVNTSTTTVASPTVTTTYTLIVTDNQPCISTPVFVTVTVNSLAAPVITAAPSFTICNGSSTTLTASGGATYVWNPGGSTTAAIVVNPASSTGYTVTATNGCSSSSSQTVTVNSLPTISVSGTNSVCSGTSTTLTATGGSTYVWSPGGSTAASIVVTPTAASTYTVVGTNSSNCSNTATYAVSFFTVPTLTISGVNSICPGSSTNLNVSGASTYVWSPSGSLNNANISNPVATPSTTTNYSVVATGANSCTTSSSYNVTVFPTPTVTISGTVTMCSGQNATLTGGGASTYLWNPGSLTGGSISVPLTSSTTYTVVGTDANSCTGTATHAITVNPLPTANAGPDVSVCAGDNTTFNGTGNGTFQWSPANGLSCTTCANPVCTPTGAATYTLTVTNVCGTANDFISVTYPALPSANAGPDVTICPGGSTPLTGTGSGTFAWSPNTALSCTVCASPVANPTTTTTYTFSITATCGTNSDDVTVTVANPVAGITGNTTVCSGQTTTLTGSGGVNYSWSTGAITNPITANPTASTTYTVIATDGSGCTDDASITVNPSPLPSANAGTDVSICIGSSTTLTVTGSGTYLWSPATGLSCTTCANATANPTTTTTYTVTVTNNCGSAADSVMVSITTTPSVNAGSDVSFCVGGSVSLSANGSGGYQWTPATGLSNATIANPVANPTTTTHYTVTITDVCGTSADSLIVTVNPLPVVNISGADTICFGTSETLVASGGGTYVWTGGSTSNSLVVSPTSLTGYTVTVTSAAGCTSSSSFTVNVSPANASVTGANSICSGQSSTLTASGGGTYAWNTGSSSTSIIVSPTSLTNYTVIVTGALGCTKSVTYSVNVTPQPTASVTASSTTICSGTTATLSASGGSTYSWNTGSSASTIVVNPASSTNYTVTVSNGACSSDASIAVTVNTTPTASVTATASSICIGSCTSLSASGGSTYVWSPGGQTGSVINACPTSSATYTVTATSANGCTDDATTLINVLPLVNATVTGDSNICVNDPTVLTATGGGTYLWNPGGATTASITVNPIAGTGYTVTVSNGACSDAATVFVTVNPLPVVSATASPYTINIGAQTTLTGTSSTGSYTWTPSTGLSSTTDPNPVANPTVTTIYTLSTIDANGCVSVDTVIVNVTMECEEVFIPSAFSPNLDGFNDFLYVRNACIEEMDFRVYNRWGQKVFSTTDKTEGWDGKLHGKLCDPAVFFYTLYIKFITGTDKTIDGNVTLVR